MRKHILVLFGTRPEVIKLAPVVKALRQRPDNFFCQICSTGQHREMVQQALEAFDLEIDIKFDAMSFSTSLGRLTARLFEDVDNLLEDQNPDWVIVQGDTTSSMVGGVCAFYRRIKIGHVEAGLRTYDRWSPFPEEVNRSFISKIADIHFAPTNRAANNLRNEGIADQDIHVTGNTVVDALISMKSSIDVHNTPHGLDADILMYLKGRRLVLVTSHRRESFGVGLERICNALLKIVERYEDVVVIYPVHLNPSVRNPVYRLLGEHPRIKLLETVAYLPLIWLMNHSYCILTDSGGIQEEAPSLNKPVLIMRDNTERPEVIEAGCARLVGTEIETIMNGVSELLDNPYIYRSMADAKNPFGDGCAAERIADLLLTR